MLLTIFKVAYNRAMDKDPELLENVDASENETDGLRAATVAVLVVSDDGYALETAEEGLHCSRCSQASSAESAWSSGLKKC